MSSSENLEHSPLEGLQIPGLVQSEERVEQLSFTVNPQTPTPLSPSLHQSAFDLADLQTVRTPATRVGLADTPLPASAGGPSSSPGLNEEAGVAASGPISQAEWASMAGTQALALRPLTQALPSSQSGISTQTLTEMPPDPKTTASRPPVIIRGGQQGKAPFIRPPQGRRHVIGIAALLLLLVVSLGTLFAVSPLSRDVKSALGVQPGGGASIIQNTRSGTMDLVAQATATAVVHQQNDGLDPTSNGGGPVVVGSPRSWPLGVCTYWANLRYHQLTGHWVTWTGNAYQWAEGARLAGWTVSTTPHVPSIIVLMPGVQGASGYGHVAVVESANGNSAYTSNMNWYANGGGWDVVSYYTFTAGPGVYFIWA